MKTEDRKKIEEIMGGIQCSKGFKCAESGFDTVQLCKAETFFGVVDYLGCLDANPKACSFALSFGNGFLCQCPLRVYLAKKLGK